jgi:hypothetical protein
MSDADRKLTPAQVGESGRAHKERPPAHSHPDHAAPIVHPPKPRPHVTAEDITCAYCEAGDPHEKQGGSCASEVQPKPKPRLKLRRGDRSRVRPVGWLWEKRIPKGKASLLVAEESGGKGTLESYLTIRAIRGELEGDMRGQPINVLIIGDEDGFEDTWMPRLHAAGASWDEIEQNVLTLAPGDVLDDLSKAQDLLLQAVIEENVGWVIFDALLDHIDGGKDGSGVYNPKAVRNALKPLRDVAKAADIAVTGNLHPIKGSPKTFRELIGSSHQFNAVARSSLWLGQDPDSQDSSTRVLVRGKGNLSAEPPCVEFRIEGKQFSHNGHSFDMPRVVDVKEGERYRRDFEGERGTGFGKKQTIPAAQRDAEQIEALLHHEIPQGPVTLAQKTGINRRSITRALNYLEDNRRAKKTGEKKSDGWISTPLNAPEVN